MEKTVWFLAVLVVCALLTGCPGEPFIACEECTGSGGNPTGSSSDISTSTTSTSGDGGGGASTSSSSGGQGGGGSTSSSSGGQGGMGGNDCPDGKKSCDGDCVQINDPDYGCSPDGCEPCALDHASATCEAGACAIAACEPDFDDCDGEHATGCETDLLNDLDHCGVCNDACAVTNAACMDGVCTGPCGTVPVSGLFVCWVPGTPVPPNQYVGLAGGSADPDLGETIQTKFLDPMCVNPNSGESFVLCDLGTPDSNWDIQFRAGFHVTPGTGTSAGTWDCSDATCSGSVYVYQDKAEIGSLVSNVETGAVSTLPHFNPPGLKNVKVTAP